MLKRLFSFKASTGENVFRSDIVLNLLWRIFRTPFRIYLGALVLNAIILLIALYYSITLSENEVVPLWNPGQLLQSLSVALVISPAIFAYSLWQPMAVEKILESLETKNLVADTVIFAEAGSAPVSIRKILENTLNRKRLSYLSLVITIIGTLTFYLVILPRESAAYGGKISSVYVRPTILIGYMMFLALHFYLISLFSGRTLATIDGLNIFLSRPGSIKKLSLFDPDQSGGFGAIGSYCLGLGGFALIIGYISVTSTIHPLIAGGDFNASVAISTSIMYVCLLPIFLIGPAWSTHKAMLKYRDKLIMQLADETDKIMHKFFCTDIDDLKDSEKTLTHLKKLSEALEFITKNMPVWPFGGFAIRRLSIVAIAPIVINAISIVLDLLKK